MADLPSRAETLRSLSGAWRLLTFRQEGFGFFAKDAGAVWRSFFAMILAAPAFALQLESFRGELGLEDPGLHFYAVWALTYVCFWFAVPLEMQHEVWPTEDYELADSRVPTTIPEDDLFAGLRVESR